MRGRAEARSAAALLARAFQQMRCHVGVVVTSPYRRCVETARPLASILDRPLVEDRRLRPGFESTDFAGIVEGHPDLDLALVGHEPDLSSLLHYLSGVRLTMPKGGAARLDVLSLRPGGSELRWFLRPKQLRLIASARVSA